MRQVSHIQDNNNWDLEETIRQAEETITTDVKTSATETTNAEKLQTRRERLKSALYLRLKKRKKNFKKFFEYFFFQKLSHSAKKCKWGDPLGFINIYSVAKYQKTRKGDSFYTL